MEKKEITVEFETIDIVKYLGYFGLLLFALIYMANTAIAGMAYGGALEGAGLWIFYLSILFLILMPIFRTINAKKLARGSFGLSMILVSISMFTTDKGGWRDAATTNWNVASALTFIVGLLFLVLAWFMMKEDFKEKGYTTILWLVNGILVFLTVWFAGRFYAKYTGGTFTKGFAVRYADLYPQLIYFGGQLSIFWAVGTIVTSILSLSKKYGIEHDVIDKVHYVLLSLTWMAFLIGTLYAGMGFGWPVGTPTGAIFIFFSNFGTGYTFLWALLGICLILTILYNIIKEGKAVTA
ncbi:MAG: hypothetical protein GWO20_02070 [Candidatus Korarchaeota archaeon]|nr:hypothetical protein [Candidatus Korarchaeota archaeon]NIU84620.1 hypothetical protein [Candidatus Thorarchaeota archaeon]NIW12762.1 hypothetical protein [Candidatus Thorarchaeota archaeon]NIW50970.1 hypothetical protein [Candidatus Korarchaeota archaeon]